MIGSEPPLRRTSGRVPRTPRLTAFSPITGSPLGEGEVVLQKTPAGSDVLSTIIVLPRGQLVLKIASACRGCPLDTLPADAAAFAKPSSRKPSRKASPRRSDSWLSPPVEAMPGALDGVPWRARAGVQIALDCRSWDRPTELRFASRVDVSHAHRRRCLLEDVVDSGGDRPRHTSRRRQSNWRDHCCRPADPGGLAQLLK